MLVQKEKKVKKKVIKLIQPVVGNFANPITAKLFQYWPNAWADIKLLGKHLKLNQRRDSAFSGIFFIPAKINYIMEVLICGAGADLKIREGRGVWFGLR